MVACNPPRCIAALDGVKPAGFLVRFIKGRQGAASAGSSGRQPQLIALGNVFLIVEDRRSEGRAFRRTAGETRSRVRAAPITWAPRMASTRMVS